MIFLENYAPAYLNTRKRDVVRVEPGTRVWVWVKGKKVAATMVHDNGYQTLVKKDVEKNSRYKVINAHKSHISLRL